MAEAKKNAPGAAPGGKKGKKQIQKKSLGEFLGVQKGTSWASDDEEEFMNAPATTETGARDASDWRAGPSKGDGEHRPFASSGGGGGKGGGVLPDRPPYTLYVGNLAFGTTEEEIAQFFRTSESVRLVVDRATNASKGYGYVTFPSRDDLANALKQDGQQLGGRPVRLDVAADRGGKGGGKGGGGFTDGSGGFGGGGFSGGRDFMGTGQVERPERPEPGQGRVNKPMGGFGGGPSWDKGRDAMGSGVVEGRPAARDRPAQAFSRDTMGSEQGAAPTPFGTKPERRGFGGDPDGWSAGRDAMGTGVVEERKPPPPREDRPPRDAPAFSRDTMGASEGTKEGEPRPARAAPNRLMFGASDAAPSRDLFGAEEAPERPERVERPERPPRPEPWRPGGKGAATAAADPSGGSNWRAGPSAPHASGAGAGQDSPAKQLSEPKPYQPKNKQTSQELEVKPKEKPAPKVPLTQEELFQQQVAKTQKKEQQAKAAKEKTSTQANFNPWEALGGKKKKKKKGKKEEAEDADDEEEED